MLTKNFLHAPNFLALTCKTNQIFDLRSECPKTCLDPSGSNDCGETKTTEGCFCATGYVLNSNGDCVQQSTCGCTLPDNSSTIEIGQTVMSLDCAFIYTCSKSSAQAIATEYTCSANSVCQADAQGKAKCVCKTGYYGDGVSCVVDPCDATPNPCGPGSLCSSANGVAACQRRSVTKKFGGAQANVFKRRGNFLKIKCVNFYSMLKEGVTN